MSHDQAPPPPPGRRGWPILGETLAFLRDPFGFVEAGARRYGPVFSTNALGRRTAVITGPDATAKFIDADDVQRQGGMPANIQTLFGGHTLPDLDGEEHHARKRIVMAAFTPEALAAYLPGLQTVVRAALARCAEAGEVRAVDELRRMAVEAIARAMINLPPGPELDALLADYGVVLRGFRGLPVPLPGTAYSKAKAAMRRVLGVWEAQIRRHQASPGQLSSDGLGRILAARAPDGQAPSLDADAIARELHHLILAGLIVWAWCARVIVELDRDPEVRRRLHDDVAGLPDGPPTMEALAGLGYLDRLADEVRRATPVVPIFFGKARRTFTFAGHSIPAGWMVLWGATASHARPEIYPSPEKFDPERFAPARAEHARHPHAFAPNGAGDPVTNHKCAGYRMAPTLLKVFIVELVRGYTFALAPGQDLSYDWSQAPPPYRDGLRVRITAR